MAASRLQADEERSARRSASGRVMAWFGGVLLPLAAFLVEVTTGMCADAFFDPIPTPVHVVAVLLPPVVVAWGLLTSNWAGRPPSIARDLAWGAAVGVSAWYAAMYVPLYPMAVLAILFAGLGLLPLAPLAAVGALIGVRDRDTGRPVIRAAGIVLGLAAISAADLPRAAAHVLLVRARSHDTAAAASALRNLRAFVPDESILAAARKNIPVTSPVAGVARLFWPSDGWGDLRVPAWRATGRLAPSPWDDPDSFLWLGDGWGFDADQGGDDVGEMVDDICLEHSEITGEVDVASGLADIRWEMTFRNDGPSAQEARGRVRLPPGAVVADATLWVAGTPRPAVFSRTVKVREAYENVVRVERRDPLLVTYAGADEVLLQCFPVPPRGQTIRVRIRIAAPLEMTDEGTSLRLPRFDARAFEACGGLAHSARVTAIGGDEFPVTWDVGEPSLDAHGILRIDGLPADGPVWGLDPFAVDGVLVRTTEVGRNDPLPALAIVLDASSSTAEARSAAERALKAVPDGVRVGVIVASDEVLGPTALSAEWDGAALDAAREDVAAAPWSGGVDATPALRRAAELVAGVPGGRILWLHGSQRFVPGAADEFRDPSAVGESAVDVPVHAVRIGAGRNLVLSGLRRAGLVREHNDAPAALIDRWLTAAERSETRTLTAVLGSLPVGARETALPRALAALYAATESDRLWEVSREQATDLAVAYRVVTPTTGAVVLETDEDYRQAGLDDGASPVPEPGTWALLIVAGLALLVIWRRRSRVESA